MTRDPLTNPADGDIVQVRKKDKTLSTLARCAVWDPSESSAELVTYVVVWRRHGQSASAMHKRVLANRASRRGEVKLRSCNRAAWVRECAGGEVLRAAPAPAADRTWPALGSTDG